MLFLKILLGAVLLLVLLGVVAFYWLRHKIRKHTAGYRSAAPYIPPLQARVRLEPVRPGGGDDDEGREALEQLTARLTACGLKAGGEFMSSDDARHLIMMQHPSGVVGVASSLSGKPFCELYAVYDGGKATLLTESPLLDSFEQGVLRVTASPSLPVAEAIQTLQQGGTPRKLSLHQFALAYERIYAACMDRLLAAAPSEALLSRWAAFQGLDEPAEADRAEALRLSRQIYHVAVEEAIRDNARKATKIDAEAWGRIEDRVVVLSRSTEMDELAGLFENELVSDLVEQFERQKMSVSQAFAAVNLRLGADECLVPLASVSRPVPAELFIKPIYLEGIDVDVPAFKPGPGLSRFLFRATDADGAEAKSSLVAANVADARAQLHRMGYGDAQILTGSISVATPDDADMALLAEGMVEAQSDSIGKAVWKIFIGNWLLWGPFLLWSLSALYAGEPYGWNGYAAFLVTPLAMGYALYRAVPSVLYNALLEARAWGRVPQMRRCVALLRRIPAQGLTAPVLASEEARVMAAEGRVEEALALLAAHRKGLEPLVYLTFESQVYDAARDYPRMIDTQAKMVRHAPENQEVKVDLALSLLRYTDRHDEAERLLGGLHPRDCSDLFMAGLHYAQGLLLGRQGRFDAAVKRLQQSLEGFKAFNNPLLHALTAEIRGYTAVFLQRAGETEKARLIWNSVLPRLKALRAEHLLSLYAG